MLSVTKISYFFSLFLKVGTCCFSLRIDASHFSSSRMTKCLWSLCAIILSYSSPTVIAMRTIWVYGTFSQKLGWGHGGQIVNLIGIEWSDPFRYATWSSKFVFICNFVMPFLLIKIWMSKETTSETTSQLVPANEHGRVITVLPINHHPISSQWCLGCML